MVVPRLQRDLQGIVVGPSPVLRSNYIVRYGNWLAIRPDFSGGIDVTVVVERRACQAGDRAGRSGLGRSAGPPSAKRRLVKVFRVLFVTTVVADVGHVQRQVIGDGPLDVQIPLEQSKVEEVGCYAQRWSRARRAVQVIPV